VNDGQLVFGSEIKAILAYPGIRAEIDPASLDQIFTYWSTLSPRTVFRNINDVPPGHYLLAMDGQYTIHPYWSLNFSQESLARTKQDYLDELESRLVDAARIRLRADVPVGAYLSGGLDSSLTTAIIRNYTHNRLDTFSIAFVDDPEFDESQYQRQMAAHLGTDHRVVECTHADIGRVFPDVIWHTETPILRTSPAPMFLLSKLVNDHHLKVVLTGEGSDEFLAGYDIFKEAKIRRFWAKYPESQMRSMLLKRLYPDIAGIKAGGDSYLAAFFKKDLTDTGSPYYSHTIRWANTARTRRFLLGHSAEPSRHPEPPPPPPAFESWSPLAQAQYWEIAIFLSQYLLSSQGDRVAMAHSVEGRFPFLDYRVVDFCSHLPADLKLRGLTEKWLLKQLGRKLLPSDIWQRPKRPYRAPIHRSFFSQGTPDYVCEVLSEEALQESGLFNPFAVTRLFRKAAGGARLSEVDDMAVAGILSTQLVYQQFVKAFRLAPVSPRDRIKVVDRVVFSEERSLWMESHPLVLA
jgi:asparagine synthase (glutamine-hydrolysing)